MQAFSLYEGSYSVDSSKKFIPFDPLKDDPKDRKGSLFIHIHPFLIQTAKDLILLDTGLGYKDDLGNLALHNNIKKAGFDPRDVSFVLMSHLHQDHAGGMVFEHQGKLQLAFPEAEYIVSRGEWETGYSGKSGSYKTAIFDVLQRSGNLELVEGNGRINDTITYEHSGGHTEFHQVFHISENNSHYFFGGDELPEPEQLLRKFVAKYDFDGKKAMQLREEYGNKAAEEGWICMFYHSTGAPFGKVSKVADSFRVEPLDS
ncbi:MULTISPECIES: MBL fold metallo-hydrolase [Olivibacter]|uniref:MBL fold metallo-hydrolase n=1 Tax=Olivibacter oleidegradans TaxID=760123 RepID=A0ABV6HDK3_9SPHI|nr:MULTISPECIES: MBL fold metallo-hydrolase [Olivibacter]QEK99308.1 MBL fold metallo-hydrolase [Olivibacter sp. LS-1]